MLRRTLRLFTIFVGILTISSSGCDDAYLASESAQVQSDLDSDDYMPESLVPGARYSQTGLASSGEDITFAAEAKRLDSRKIIYEAEVTLVVDDVSTVHTEIGNLVKQFGGYVAEESIDGNTGLQRTGRWRVRVPVGGFDSFIDSVTKLGVAEHRQTRSQDVTEEFVDLHARITNEKRLEERILKLLEDPEGKIKEVIAVEQELARVRGSIEQMEGRLRYLTNRTELTTVSINAREERDYVPPEAPTFAGRIQSAWSNSLFGLRSFGENLAVAAVSASPWIVVVGAFLVPGLWAVKRRVRPRNAQGHATASL